MKKAIELVQEIQNDRKNRQEESNLGGLKPEINSLLHTYLPREMKPRHHIPTKRNEARRF
jgi:hypothetical protein